MKKAISLLLALSLLLSLCACGKKDKTTPEENVAVNRVLTELQFSDGSVTARFTCTDGVWSWLDGPDFPLDGTFLDQLQAALTEVLGNPPVGKLTDPSTCGLDSATTYISAVYGDETVTLQIGKQSTDGRWYMCHAGQEDTYYLVEDAFVQMLSTPVFDMAVLPVLPTLSEENIQSVCISRAEDAQQFLLFKDGRWFSGGKAFSGADSLLQELSSLCLLKCIDYAPAGGAAAVCGLDTPLSVTVIYTNSVGSEATLSLQIGKLFLDESGYYATVNDDATIYLLGKDGLATILAIAEKIQPPADTESTGD